MSENAGPRSDDAPTVAIETIVHPAPHPEQELIMSLEPDQLVEATFLPVPRAILSRPAVIGLWSLRVFCVLVSAMVVYTFVERLN